jgi:hypothetical protein
MFDCRPSWVGHGAIVSIKNVGNIAEKQRETELQCTETSTLGISATIARSD